MSYEAPASGAPAADATPPKKKSKAPLIIGIVIAVIVVCCGGGAALWAGFGDDLAKEAQTAASEAAEDTANGKPTSVDDAQPGQCIKTSGSEEEGNVKAEPVRCTDPGAQKVVERKDGVSDPNLCKTSDAYGMDIDPGVKDDYVLCLEPATGSASPSANG